MVGRWASGGRPFPPRGSNGVGELLGGRGQRPVRAFDEVDRLRGRSVRVSGVDALGAAIKRALAADGPTVLELRMTVDPPSEL